MSLPDISLRCLPAPVDSKYLLTTLAVHIEGVDIEQWPTEFWVSTMDPGKPAAIVCALFSLASHVSKKKSVGWGKRTSAAV